MGYSPCGSQSWTQLSDLSVYVHTEGILIASEFRQLFIKLL